MERGGGVESRDIAEVLTQVAADAAAQPDLQRTLERVAAGATDTVPGAKFASVSLLESGTIRTAAATDPVAERIDEIQYDCGQGPCVDVIAEEPPAYRSGDLRADTRWPLFGPAAAKLGVRSMLAYQLQRPGGRLLGALNLFSTAVDAFDAEDVHVAGLFATHAAIAIGGELDRTHLQAAVRTRDAIGTAKGILMCRHTLTDDGAFAMLSAASQRSNRKLRDIADWIIQDANTAASDKTRPEH